MRPSWVDLFNGLLQLRLDDLPKTRFELFDLLLIHRRGSVRCPYARP